jgi:hypothetical protein
MRNHLNRGNAVSQYAIIIGLVIIGIIPVFYGLGKLIFANFDIFKTMLSSDSGALIHQNTQGDQPSSGIPSNSDTEPAIINTSTDTSAIVSKEVIAGYEVNIHQDGTSSFSVLGQEIRLTPAMMKLNEEMFVGVETSGVTGKEKLVSEIGYLIEKTKNQYPGQDVPIDLSYGSGDRAYKTILLPAAAYENKAEYNTLKLEAGDEFILLQYDKSCKGTTCEFPGVYRIEGSSDTTGKFNADVTVTSKDREFTGSYSGKLKDDTLDGEFVLHDTIVYKKDLNYDWKLNYSNTDTNFDLTK